MALCYFCFAIAILIKTGGAFSIYKMDVRLYLSKILRERKETKRVRQTEREDVVIVQNVTATPRSEEISQQC